MYYQPADLLQPRQLHTLRGQPVAVRPVAPADVVLLADLLCRLSESALRLRYMTPRAPVAEALWSEAARMARGHTEDHTTLVVVAQRGAIDEAIAVAELIRDAQTPTVGEIALIVRDDQQSQGIGSLLLWQLVCAAQRSGITYLHAEMLAENKAMLRLIQELDLPYTATTSRGATRVFVAVPAHLTVARGVRRFAA
jgi:acetyltransferase